MFKIFEKKAKPEKPWYEIGGYPKPIKPAKLDKPWKSPSEQSPSAKTRTTKR